MPNSNESSVALAFRLEMLLSHVLTITVDPVFAVAIYFINTSRVSIMYIPVSYDF